MTSPPRRTNDSDVDREYYSDVLSDDRPRTFPEGSNASKFGYEAYHLQGAIGNFRHVKRLSSSLPMYTNFANLFSSINGQRISNQKHLLHLMNFKCNNVSSEKHFEIIDEVSLRNMIPHEDVKEYVHEESGRSIMCFEPFMRLVLPFNNADICKIESESQFELLLQLAHCTGFVCGIEILKTFHDKCFIYISNQHNNLPQDDHGGNDIAEFSSLSDDGAEDYRIGTFLPDLPAAGISTTSSIASSSSTPRYDVVTCAANPSSVTNNLFWYTDTSPAVLYYGSRPYSEFSRGNNSSRAIKSDPAPLVHPKYVEILADTLLSQLEDFVKVYISVSEWIYDSNASMDINSADTHSSPTRSIILQSILDMITHNHKVLRILRIDALKNDQSSLRHFTIWQNIYKCVKRHFRIRNDASGLFCNDDKPGLIEKNKHSLAFLSDIARLERKLFDTLKVKTTSGKTLYCRRTWCLKNLLPADLLGDLRWYLTAMRNHALGVGEMIQMPLHTYHFMRFDIPKSYTVEEIDGNSILQHAFGQPSMVYAKPKYEKSISNNNNVENILKHLFELAMSSNDELHNGQSSSVMTRIISSKIGMPNFNIVSSSGRRYTLHSWILLTLWPYFRDVAKSGLSEISERIIVFGDIDDSMMQHILRFVLHCNDVGDLNSAFSRSDIAQIKSFMNKYAKLYKLEFMATRIENTQEPF